MGGQQVVDLLGVDVLPAADDHVLDAVHDEDVAVLVHDPHVPGVQEAVHDGFGGVFGAVEVALHDRVAADADFTGFPPGALAAVFGQDLHLLPGQGQADGAHLAHPVPGVEGAHAGGFGEAVAFHDGNIEGLLELAHGFFGQRRRAADPELQAAQVVFLAGGVGEQDLVDGRHRRPEVDPVAVHHLPELAGRELPAQHDLQADAQSEGARQHGIDMKQGQKDQGGHVLREVERPGHPVHVGQDVLVGQQHPLGVAGGAGSVEDIGGLVFPALADHRCVVAFGQQGGKGGVLGPRVGAHLDDLFQVGAIGLDLVQDGQVLVLDDQPPALGVVEQVLHLGAFHQPFTGPATAPIFWMAK